MKKRPELYEYPAKILVSFGEAISGNVKILQWLLENGFPELAALASAIRGNEEAFKWLLNNGFPHLAALDAAIDDSEKANKWLADHGDQFLVVFSDATKRKPEAINWLKTRDLVIFIRLAQKINTLRNSQEWDYHKIHF